jgi:pimeloyl-ACP methyl ester carboxylesterase
LPKLRRDPSRRRPASWRLLRPEPVRFWRGRRLPHVVAGSRGAGQPVLLLHGQPGSASDWAAVTAALEVDHLLIVPDRPGYGLTGGRAGGFSANARALERLLVGLGVEGAIVVGHSWAGGVAMQMAVDFPHLVSGLVLVSSVAPDDRPGRLDRILARPVVGTALAAITLSAVGRALSWRPGRAWARRRLQGQRPEQLREVARAWRRPSTWHSFAIEQRALVHELPRLSPRLASISVPTVVVVGSADRLVPPASGRRLAVTIPGAALHEVAGGGHLLPQSRPAEVAGAVRLASSLPGFVPRSG